MRTNPIRWLRAALVVLATSLPPGAGATAFSTNYSDLWWVPTESGWGANVSQQAATMFVTMFVYGPSGQPAWYVATLDYIGTNVAGEAVFRGDLLATVGPWFGGPWIPAQYQWRKVGTMTFQSAFVAQATLSYTVDGTSVVKPIERQTLRNNDMTGTYYGGTIDTTYGCGNPFLNGITTRDSGAMVVTQNGPLIQIQTPTCRFSGTYTQQGQIGRADTTYVCTSGAVGSVTFFDMVVETSGVLGRYTGHDNVCSFDGSFGGVRW